MSQNAEQQAPLRITVSEVKSLLDQGKSRKEIADYYGKTQAEMQRMVWSSPKLKNLKAKKQYTGVELIDDEESDGSIAEVNDQISDAVSQAPESVQAFKNQEEIGNDEAIEKATEEIAPATAEWV
jgi:hypothetical protein